MRINSLDVEALQFLPQRGGGFIPTPKTFQRCVFQVYKVKATICIFLYFNFSKGIINIRSDHSCFKYSILCSLYRNSITLRGYEEFEFSHLPPKQKQYLRSKWTTVSSYKFVERRVKELGLIDFKDYEKEVDVDSLDLFEERNNIGITVFGISNGRLHPIRSPSSKGLYRQYADLVLLKKDRIGSNSTVKTFSHFTVATDLGKNKLV